MKKFIGLSLVLLLSIVLVGCGSDKKEDSKAKDSGTLNCSKVETNDDGYKESDKISVDYEKGKVKKVSQTNIEEMDPELIDLTLSFGQIFTEALSTIDGFEMSYEKEGDNAVKMSMVVDFTKIDLEKLKEELGDSFDDSSYYSDTDISIDEFKKENLDGYTCE